jgi:flavin-dependent dehydrogenase
VLEGRSVEDNFTPFLIPVGGPLRNPGRGRVLLAGDAGGFVNGFTAEGIYYAMVSGDLAARTVAGMKRGGEAALASRYAKACEGELGPELRDSVHIQRYMFGSRKRIRDVIDGATREKAITGLVLDFAVGKMPYRTLKRRMLTRAPMLAARVVWERIRHGHD